MDKMPKKVAEQCLPQQSSWVRCNGCFKWRSIPAALADSIEETHTRWICKDNMDKGFADCSIPQAKSTADAKSELEVSDVSCEEDSSDALFIFKRLQQKNSTELAKEAYGKQRVGERMPSASARLPAPDAFHAQRNLREMASAYHGIW